LSTKLTLTSLFKNLSANITNSNTKDVNSANEFQANDRITFTWSEIDQVTNASSSKSISYDLNIDTKSIARDNTSTASLSDLLTQVGNNIDTQLNTATKLKSSTEKITTGGFDNSMKYISIYSHPNTTQTYVSYLLTNIYKSDVFNTSVASTIGLSTTTSMGKEFAKYFTLATTKFENMIKYIIINSTAIGLFTSAESIDLYANTTFSYGAAGTILAATGTVPQIMIKFQSDVDPVPIATDNLNFKKNNYLTGSTWAPSDSNFGSVQLAYEYAITNSIKDYKVINIKSADPLMNNVAPGIYLMRGTVAPLPDSKTSSDVWVPLN
jgi:hypothetical protein